MAILVYMHQKFYLFLNRPIAEDFRSKNQIWQSLKAGLYVFLFVHFLVIRRLRQANPGY